MPRLAPRGFYNLFVNQAKLDAAGISDIRTIEDLQRAAKELTRPAANQYALGTYSTLYYGMPNIAAAYGAPMEWRLGEGKLTRDIETAEYKAAVETTSSGSDNRDPFDVVVIGAGMLGGYIADKLYRTATIVAFACWWFMRAASLSRRMRTISRGWGSMRRSPDTRDGLAAGSRKLGRQPAV